MRGSAEARVRSEVDRLVRDAGARAGLLLSQSGMVRARAGPTHSMEMPTVASLMAAQSAAASSLATLVCGRDFSTFIQKGSGSALVVDDLGDGWLMALLLDDPGSPWARIDGSADRVGGLKEAVGELASRGDRDPGVGEPWASEAESRIDRIFREGA